MASILRISTVAAGFQKVSCFMVMFFASSKSAWSWSSARRNPHVLTQARWLFDHTPSFRSALALAGIDVPFGWFVPD
jgi:hypothetical protein